MTAHDLQQLLYYLSTGALLAMLDIPTDDPTMTMIRAELKARGHAQN